MGSSYPPQQPYYMPPTAPDERPPSWFQRNRKVALAGGCALVAFVLLLVAGLVAAIVFGVMSLVKSSGAYGEALTLAKKNAEVRAALGEPIEEGWFVTGNVKTSGASGEASLEIPLSGPRGAATLYVEGRQSANTWRYSVMEVVLEGSGKRITLLSRGSASRPEEISPESPPPQPSPDEPPVQSPQ